MTEQDHELLSQYLDGELGASQVLQLERRLAAEPSLQARLERMEALNNKLISALNTEEAERVPAAIKGMLQQETGKVVAFPGRKETAWGFAVAASLLAASGLLFFEQSAPGTDPHAMADNLLAQALEHTPSRGEGWDLLADGRQLRPVLSFHSEAQGWCREYRVIEQGAHARGVACKGEHSWVTKALSPQLPSVADSANDYRPAGADQANQVDDFVTSHADKIALSASEEARKISTGWK
jgi:hypothetical protein